ncbi:MAG: hypothetical protein EA379_11020 [Phycisphaerales bacterium]|nr:MAG: hypothetical protein EA379_11020 [Phycisphaerales bacterium]
MSSLAAGVLPAWLIMPVALLGMLFIAWYTVAVERSDHPVSRKRIRTANGWVMLLAAPLVGAGFSLVNAESQPRAFLLVWAAAMLLVLLSVALAIADMFNTMRLARKKREELAMSLSDGHRKSSRAGGTLAQSDAQGGSGAN